MSKSTFAAILKNKGFSRLWASYLLSHLTASMLNYILMIRIFEASQSTVAIGFLYAFYVLPTIILGPFSGTLVDAFDKRRIMIKSSLLQAGIVLFYLGLGSKIWPIYTIVLLYSFCDEFFGPAFAASLPKLVAKDHLPAANTYFTLTGQTSMIGGFVLGSLLLRLFPPIFVFPLASLMLLASAFAASRLPPTAEPKKPLQIGHNLNDFSQKLAAGYRFVRQEHRVLVPILMLAGLQTIISLGMILLPTYALNSMKITVSDAGFVLVIPAVIGAALGSILVEKFIKTLGKKKLIIRGLFCLSLGIFLLFAAPFISRQLPLLFSLPTLIILGLSFVLISIPLQTLIQETTPADIRGRVFGILNMMITLTAIIPSLISATLVDFFGINLVLLMGALGIFVFALYAAKGRYAIAGTNHRPGNSR